MMSSVLKKADKLNLSLSLSPVMVRYGVSVVILISGSLSATVIVVSYVISQ